MQNTHHNNVSRNHRLSSSRRPRQEPYQNHYQPDAAISRNYQQSYVSSNLNLQDNRIDYQQGYVPSNFNLQDNRIDHPQLAYMPMQHNFVPNYPPVHQYAQPQGAWPLQDMPFQNNHQNFVNWNTSLYQYGYQESTFSAQQQAFSNVWQSQRLETVWSQPVMPTYGNWQPDFQHGSQWQHANQSIGEQWHPPRGHHLQRNSSLEQHEREHQQQQQQQQQEQQHGQEKLKEREKDKDEDKENEVIEISDEEDTGHQTSAEAAEAARGSIARVKKVKKEYNWLSWENSPLALRTAIDPSMLPRTLAAQHKWAKLKEMEDNDAKLAARNIRKVVKRKAPRAINNGAPSPKKVKIASKVQHSEASDPAATQSASSSTSVESLFTESDDEAELDNLLEEYMAKPSEVSSSHTDLDDESELDNLLEEYMAKPTEHIAEPTNWDLIIVDPEQEEADLAEDVTHSSPKSDDSDGLTYQHINNDSESEISEEE